MKEIKEGKILQQHSSAAKLSCSSNQKDNLIPLISLLTHRCQLQDLKIFHSYYQTCAQCQKENPIPSSCLVSIRKFIEKNEFTEIQLDPQVSIKADLRFYGKFKKSEEIEQIVSLLNCIVNQLINARCFRSLDLKLSNINNLQKQQLADISTVLVASKECSQLALDLIDCDIQNEDLICLGLGLSQFKQLQSLSLNFDSNKLSSKGEFYLSEALRKLTQLTYLKINFEFNRGLNSIMNICKALIHFTNLVSLELNIRLINLASLEPLSELLPHLILLESLSLILWNNDISNEGNEKLSEGIVSLKRLKSLKLDQRCTKMKVEGAKFIFSAIGKLKQLNELSLILANNKIEDEAVIFLSKELSKLQQLNQLHLDVSFNELSLETAGNITKEINQLPIKCIKLFANQKVD